MYNKYRFWLLAFPDISRPIGGVKQLHRLAESLHILGCEATIVQDDASFVPGWFHSFVSTISKNDWINNQILDPKFDIIIMPETYLSVLFNYFPCIKKIIFNQNGSYTFGLHGASNWKPAEVIKRYNHPSVLKVWCVSQHDYSFMSAFFASSDNKVSLIANGIESACSIPKGTQKKYQICFMPRKNPRDSSIVCSLLLSQPWFLGWSIQPIQNLDHEQVIEVFKESLIFLSFGHPEGFGLPVAEAMACGCAVVGYSGLGGRELFQLAQSFQLGIAVEFGDWMGFITGAKIVMDSIVNSPKEHVSNAFRLSSRVLDTYGLDSMTKSVSIALADLNLT